MARYIKDLPVAMSPEQAQSVITAYWQGQGFSFVTEKAEQVWKKGGMMAIPQFVKAEPQNGYVHIEAWVSGISIIPGVYAGEQGLDGAWGFAIKMQLKRRIGEFETALGGGAPAFTAAAQQATARTPAGWSADPNGRHQQRYWDGSTWTDNCCDDGVQVTDPA